MPEMRSVERKLAELQRRKDRVTELSREMVRIAGKGITLMHAKKTGAASRCVKQLDAMAKRLNSIEKGFEYYSVQAHQEYVETKAFYTILKEKRLVSFGEVHTGEVPYLLGVMDLVGELKREAIDAMRERNLEAANSYYNFMKGIYDSTRAMRFANSLVPDFRRKQDTARIQIESAASELLGFEAKK